MCRKAQYDCMDKFQLRRVRKRNAGVLSLEAAMVASLLVLALVSVGGWLKIDAERKTDQNAADHLNAVFRGAQHWFAQHYAAIEAAANPNVRYPYSVWKSAVPAALSATNIYGQTYSMRVYKEPSGALDMAVVTEGGAAIPQRSLMRIAKWIGGAGGYISGAAPADAQGAFGGWRMEMVKLGGTPGSGHLAAAVFNQARAIHNFLYRSRVPGHPEANRMETAIDMGGHDLRNGGTIRAQTAEFAHSTITVGGAQYYGDSANIALRPNGSVYFQHAWNTASPADLAAVGNIHASGNVNAVGNIQTNGSMRAQGNVQAENAGIRGDTATGGWFKTLGDGGWYNQKWQGGWMMNDPIWLRSIADKNIYTGGMVQGGAVHTNGRLSTGEYVQIDGIARAGEWCAPNGLLGRDDDGALLACQVGRWRMQRQRPADGLSGWQQVGPKGRAQQDGFLVATSCFNCALAGYTDGVQRFMISERDKYGQGRVSGTMPVARGEEWELVGAEQVWLMRLGS